MTKEISIEALSQNLDSMHQTNQALIKKFEQLQAENEKLKEDYNQLLDNTVNNSLFDAQIEENEKLGEKLEIAKKALQYVWDNSDIQPLIVGEPVKEALDFLNNKIDHLTFDYDD